MTNLEKYNQAYVEAFGVKETELEGLSYKGIPAWDSVGHMSLVAGFEDAFDIMIEADDILDFSSYEKGKEMLKKYGVEI